MAGWFELGEGKYLGSLQCSQLMLYHNISVKIQHIFLIPDSIKNTMLDGGHFQSIVLIRGFILPYFPTMALLGNLGSWLLTEGGRVCWQCCDEEHAWSQSSYSLCGFRARGDMYSTCRYLVVNWKLISSVEIIFWSRHSLGTKIIKWKDNKLI